MHNEQSPAVNYLDYLDFLDYLDYLDHIDYLAYLMLSADSSWPRSIASMHRYRRISDTFIRLLQFKKKD